MQLEYWRVNNQDHLPCLMSRSQKNRGLILCANLQYCFSRNTREQIVWWLKTILLVTQRILSMFLFHFCITYRHGIFDLIKWKMSFMGATINFSSFLESSFEISYYRFAIVVDLFSLSVFLVSFVTRTYLWKPLSGYFCKQLKAAFHQGLHRFLTLKQTFRDGSTP